MPTTRPRARHVGAAVSTVTLNVEAAAKCPSRVDYSTRTKLQCHRRRMLCGAFTGAGDYHWTTK
jgi:hypothetical protein